MQWRQTKTYLIVALLILNILLLYSIFYENQHYDNQFTKKNLNSLKNVLQEKNITYDFKLSNKSTNMKPIVIHYAKPDDDVYKKLKSNYTDNIKVIENIYIDVNIQKTISEYEELKKIADEFIKENFNINDYEIKEVINENDNMMISYEEVYDDVPVEQGYIKFIYTQSNINISILKIKDIEKVDKDIEIISNAQAISKIIPKLEKNSHITSLDKCYYFQKGDEIMTTEKLESLKLLPFYRVKIKNGDNIYIPATKN